MAKSSLERNILIHDQIAKKYERIHGEIYNDLEQARLRESLAFALSNVETNHHPRVALDFGCGAGNLTTHLTDLGCEVIAADVSSGFLNLIASRTYKNKVLTHKLNGVNLEGIENESVDMVAMYSVLHHVPDYLPLMREFARVLRKGGVLYIDHEASSSFWDNDSYRIFQREMKKRARKDLRKYFIPANYIDAFIRKFLDPKYQREGDIHVFRDDHIEWNKIRSLLEENGLGVVLEKDYLLYRRDYDMKTFEQWQNKVGDMHFLIGRKGP